MTGGIFSHQTTQGAQTTKQLKGHYFMMAYITIVLSVALGTHTAAPCRSGEGPISLDIGRYHFSIFTLPFHYVGVHTEFPLLWCCLTGVLNV